LIRLEIIDPPPHDAADARALRTLGLLTRGALHEISNPLVALVGSAELALADAEPGTKLHDRVALMHRTGREIAEIVRALQAFVRGQAEPDGPISLGAAAADAAALVTRVMPTHDVTLSAHGDASVVASPGGVRGQLVELLVEALGRDGRAGAIELRVETHGDEAVVTVTGGGELRLPLESA
jgi:two-component system heavy metal sensor histidine kinase CusS